MKLKTKDEKNPDRRIGIFLLLAEWTGFEPATPGVTGRYSNQLNYHSKKERKLYHKITIVLKQFFVFSINIVTLARLAGFEPTTPWFVAKYSIHLSYRRKFKQDLNLNKFNLLFFLNSKTAANYNTTFNVSLFQHTYYDNTTATH
jgi:hypothetical protein